MTIESMSVSLDEFLGYLLKKWIFVVVCVVLGILFAVVGAKLCGNEIVVPPSENYEELKKQEAYFEDYIDHSITMKMNPLEIYETTIFINEATDRNALKDYIESGFIWDDYETDISVRYLIELLIWQEWEASGFIELKVQHSEKSGCEQLTKYVAEQIQVFDKNAVLTLGQQKAVIDESVSDVQMWYINRLQDIKGQLEYTASGCVIRVSNVVAAFGALSGGFINVIVCFALFLSKKKIVICEEFKEKEIQ